MNAKNEKFKDITEVKELHLIKDVNRHIKLGWKLLDTYKTIGVDQNQSIKYCMGRPKSAGMVDHSINNSQAIDSEVAKKFIYSL